MNREELFKAAMMNPESLTTEEVFRQSGRTNRMLNAAASAALAGKAVLIVVKDQMHVQRARQILDDKYGRLPGVSIRGMSTNKNEYFSWDTMKGIGEYANHEVFIDHDVIYFAHRHLFEAASRWDPKFKFEGDTMSFVRS